MLKIIIGIGITIAFLDYLLIRGGSKLNGDESPCRDCRFNDREWDEDPCDKCTNENPQYERDDHGRRTEEV